MALLEVKDLVVGYGPITAVKGVSFRVEEGETVALIGANGAGKTTVMHALSGLLPKSGGTVTFAGEDVTRVPAHKLLRKGLTQVPEGRRIFQELSVRDNLVLGAYAVKDKKKVKEAFERVYEIFPILKDRSGQISGTFSGGEQQMLAVARALMSEPKMLLLDEPSMGLSPLWVNVIFDVIKEVNAAGTTIFLVEQNAKKALAAADRAYVLETGLITLEGTGEELLADEKIRIAYLGE